MKKPLNNGRVRLQSHIDPPLAQRLTAFCAASGSTERAAVQAALLQFLDRSSDLSLALRRLDRLDRAVARQHRDLQVLTEAFATWLKLWFAHTPTIPDDAKHTARATGQSRYKQFVDHLSAQLSKGARFVDDLPHEPVADESELATAAATTTSSSAAAPGPPSPKRRG